MKLCISSELLLQILVQSLLLQNAGSQDWFLTGKQFNGEKKREVFEGAHRSLFATFPADVEASKALELSNSWSALSEPHLLFGGVVGLLVPTPPYLSDLAHQSIRSLVANSSCSSIIEYDGLSKQRWNEKYDLDTINVEEITENERNSSSMIPVVARELYISENYEGVYEFEVGRYNFATKEFSDHRLLNVSIGYLLYSSFLCCHANSATSTPSTSLHCERHNISLSLRGSPSPSPDGRNPVLTLNQHTWSTEISSSAGQEDDISLAEKTNAATFEATYNVRFRKNLEHLKVCTYNIWHNSETRLPWLYSTEDKWKRYVSRIRLLARTIASADPDISLFQVITFEYRII